MSRFARQVILREVGLEGQARLERAELVLSTALEPLVAETARAYGEGAGLRTVPSSVEMSTPDWLPPLRHEAPAQIAAGALFALDAIHGALCL